MEYTPKAVEERTRSMGSRVERMLPLSQEFMLPWIGERYERTSFRLLIIGDSVYHDPKGPINWTECPRLAAIGSCEEGRLHFGGMYDVRWPGKGNFWSSVVTYVTGAELAGEEFVNVWEDWAFWELIQTPLQGSRSKPSPEQFKLGWTAFDQLVRLLKPKPDLVVGLSCRMRDEFKKAYSGRFDRVDDSDDCFELMFFPTAVRVLFLAHPRSLLYKKRTALQVHGRFLEVVARNGGRP